MASIKKMKRAQTQSDAESHFRQNGQRSVLGAGGTRAESCME